MRQVLPGNISAEIAPAGKALEALAADSEDLAKTYGL
jgi:hypothetical protein